MREAREYGDAVEQALADGLLREFARAGTGTDETFVRDVMGRVRAESAHRGRLVFPSFWLKAGLAAAACLVVAFGMWVALRGHPSSANAVGQIAAVRGDVTIQTASGTASVTAGMSLPEGGRLVGAGPDSEALLRLADGTEVRILGGADLRVSHPASGFRLGIQKGGIAADVKPQPEGKPFSVASPHGVASVLGTRLRLDVKDEFTRLDVESGKVRFVRSSDGRGADVGAGQCVDSSIPTLSVQPLPTVPARAVAVAAQPWDEPPASERPPIPAAHKVVDVENVTQLEAAIAGLRDRTTIRLRPGTYRLRKVLVLDKVTDVAIRGASGRFEDVAILGESIDRSAETVNLFDVRRARQILFADVMLGGARNHAVQLHGEVGAEGVRLFHCRVFDCGEALVKTSAGSNSGTVEYSVFEFTRIDAATGGDSAIKILGGTNWVVRRCVFRNFSSPVPSANAFKFHPAVAARDASTGTIVERCTFFNCDHAIGFGRSGPGDHSGGRLSDNVVVHQRDLFDTRTPGPYGATQRDSADAPITVWGSAGTEIARNTVLCNGNFRGAIYVRWPATGVAIRGNRTDSRILVADGAAPLLENNRQDAGADLFVSLDPTAPRRFGPRDADGRLTFAKTPGMDLRLRERVETVRLEERAK